MILISLLEITVINLWMPVGQCWCCGYNTVPHQHGENWMMLSYQWWQFYHPTPVVCIHVYAYCYCVPMCHESTILYGTLQIQVAVRSQCTLKYWNCPRIYCTCSTFSIDYHLMVWWFWLWLPNLMYTNTTYNHVYYEVSWSNVHSILPVRQTKCLPISIMCQFTKFIVRKNITCIRYHSPCSIVAILIELASVLSLNQLTVTFKTTSTCTIATGKNKIWLHVINVL